MIDPGLIDMIMSLRGRGISDNAVLKAMEQVPRKYFISPDYWVQAYEELSLPIACGQSISPPLTIAMMTQLLEIKPAHKVLEIGTGSGYHTAVLSHMSKRVYSVERYHRLIRDAESRFAQLGIKGPVIRHGDGRYGWRGQAPFERILLGCALRAAPSGLLSQLKEGGILVAVVDEELMRFRNLKGKIKSEKLLDLKLPMIEAGKSKSL